MKRTIRNLKYAALFSCIVLLFFIALTEANGQDNTKMSEADKKRYEEEILSTIQKAYKLTQESKYDQALPLAQQALLEAQKYFGPEDPLVSTALYQLATIYHSKNELTQAEELYKRSIEIAKVGGNEDEILAMPMHGLADLYFNKDEFDKAEPLYVNALAIWERVGTSPWGTISASNRLGIINTKKGNYDKAEQYIQRTLNLEEKSLGTENIETAKTLFTLVEIYIKKSEYERAEPLISRIQTILEKNKGANTPKVTSFLIAVATLYKEQNQFERAGSIYQRAIEISERAGESQYPDTSLYIYGLAEMYEKSKDYKQAELLYKRVLNNAEGVLGLYHPDLTSLLLKLAGVYINKGDFKQAEATYQRALSIQEKTSGTEDIKVAYILSDFAWMYFNKGELDKAEKLFLRNLAIAEKAPGKEELYIASSRNSLGFLYARKKNYQRAEELYQGALTLAEKKLGPEHLTVALYLSNLADVYAQKEDVGRSEELYRRALAIREKLQGDNHPDVAMLLDSFAWFYLRNAEYGKAEPLYKRALDIREKKFGNDNIEVARSLDNLANLFQQIGDYTQAEQLYQRSLSIREKALGPNDSAVGVSLNNIGSLLLDKGNYKEAEAALKRSMKIAGAAYDTSPQDMGVVLNLLALVYKAQGEFDKAEPLYQQAIKIDEKIYGPEDISVGVDIHNLALLYTARGEYAKAEPLFLRGLAIEEKTRGANHPYTADTLLSLAYFYGAKGDISKALDTLRRGTEISERNIALTLTTATGTEEQKRAFMALSTITYETQGAVSLHMQFAPNNIQAARLALVTALRRKGRILDAVSDSIQSLRRRLSTDDQKLLTQLTEARSKVATLVLNGPGSMSQAQYKAELTKVENEASKLEAAVSAKSAEFRVEVQPVTLEGVQALIPENATLIEIVSYKPFNIRYKKDDEMWGQARYAAYALSREGSLTWADLGEAAPIDNEVNKLRAALRNPKRGDVKQVARIVDEKVMRPVRKLMGDKRVILLSPDGTLNLIPFAALVDENNNYLIENYTFTYLTSGRDLIRLTSSASSKQKPVVFANPSYDTSLNNLPSQIKPSNISRSFDFSKAKFPPLPGTAEEAAALEVIIPDAKVLTGIEATKTALMQVSAPSILHVATHGFFLPDPKSEPVQKNRGTRLLVMEDGRTASGGGFENPLLRSGLAFAGANKRQDGNKDNGILTALEATGLDLWGTKLVVLSACETGVGDVKNGDGVYGLRRSLVIAGAESQVMSLWQVSDAATRDLMVDYYKRLQAGEGRTEALRQVQLAMLKTPQRSHPFYWASFIQSGAWAPIGKDMK